MSEELVIIGFGGHAKSIADSILGAGEYNIAGYTDDYDCHCDFRYLGTDGELPDLYDKGVQRAVLGVGFLGNAAVRDAIVEKTKKIGFEFPSIIDRTAVVAQNARIGEGCFIGKKSVVNAKASVGSYCIINTGAII